MKDNHYILLSGAGLPELSELFFHINAGLMMHYGRQQQRLCLKRFIFCFTGK